MSSSLGFKLLTWTGGQKEPPELFLPEEQSDLQIYSPGYDVVCGVYSFFFFSVVAY